MKFLFQKNFTCTMYTKPANCFVCVCAHKIWYQASLLLFRWKKNSFDFFFILFLYILCMHKHIYSSFVSYSMFSSFIFPFGCYFAHFGAIFCYKCVMTMVLHGRKISNKFSCVSCNDMCHKLLFIFVKIRKWFFLWFCLLFYLKWLTYFKKLNDKYESDMLILKILQW